MNREKAENQTVRKKRRKWPIILLSVLLALVIIGVVAWRIAWNYIGDKAMNMVLESQINSMLDSGELTLEELEEIVLSLNLGSASEKAESEPASTTNPKSEEAPAKQEKPSKPEEPAAKQEEPTKEAPAKQEETAKTEESAAKQEEPAKQEETKEEVATNNSAVQNSGKRQELVKEAADKIVDSVPRSDKDEMMELIRARLSSDDIRYLAGLLRGGLTREERHSAYRIAVARFSGAELDQVSMYYHRYKKQIMSEPDYK